MAVAGRSSGEHILLSQPLPTLISHSGAGMESNISSCLSFCLLHLSSLPLCVSVSVSVWFFCSNRTYLGSAQWGWHISDSRKSGGTQRIEQKK